MSDQKMQDAADSSYRQVPVFRAALDKMMYHDSKPVARVIIDRDAMAKEIQAQKRADAVEKLNAMYDAVEQNKEVSGGYRLFHAQFTVALYKVIMDEMKKNQAYEGWHVYDDNVDDLVSILRGLGYRADWNFFADKQMSEEIQFGYGSAEVRTVCRLTVSL